MSVNESSGDSSGPDSPPPPPSQSQPSVAEQSPSQSKPPPDRTRPPVSAAAPVVAAPLLYQMPANGVILSLAGAQPGGGGGASSDQPQFITIPLSVATAMAATNGHQELDLSSKRSAK